jgi:hypothetical protein
MCIFDRLYTLNEVFAVQAIAGIAPLVGHDGFPKNLPFHHLLLTRQRTGLVLEAS